MSEFVKKDGQFLGQTLTKVEPNKMKLVVKLVQKWNLNPYNLAQESK